MDFFKVVFGFLLPSSDDEIDFDDVEEDYYLTESNENMTGDSLDGGEVYNEPDYIINYVNR